jgi:AcrR family transcriptional regulator
MTARAESTIAAILGAAEDLFVRQAYADVSMRDIAQAARVTTGALYYHFPSKEKLYVRMLTHDLAAKRAAMAAAIPHPAPSRTQLRALTRVFLAMPPERRNLMRLVRRDVNVFRGRTREAIVRAYQAALPDLVEPILRAAAAAGELKARDPRWLAWAYIALVETALAPYAEARLGNLDERLDTVLDQFYTGASAAP